MMIAVYYVGMGEKMNGTCVFGVSSLRRLGKRLKGEMGLVGAMDPRKRSIIMP